MAIGKQSILDTATSFVKNSLGNAATGISRIIASAPTAVHNFAEDFNNYNNQQKQKQQQAQNDAYNFAKSFLSNAGNTVNQVFNNPVGNTIANTAIHTIAPYVPTVSPKINPIQEINNFTKPVLGGTLQDFAQGFTTDPTTAANDPRGGLTTTNLPYSFGNFLGNDLVGLNFAGGVQKAPEAFSLKNAAVGAGVGTGVTVGANALAGKKQDIPGTLLNAIIGGYLAGSHGAPSDLSALSKDEAKQLTKAEIKTNDGIQVGITSAQEKSPTAPILAKGMQQFESGDVNGGLSTLHEVTKSTLPELQTILSDNKVKVQALDTNTHGLYFGTPEPSFWAKFDKTNPRAVTKAIAEFAQKHGQESFITATASDAPTATPGLSLNFGRELTNPEVLAIEKIANDGGIGLTLNQKTGEAIAYNIQAFDGMTPDAFIQAASNVKQGLEKSGLDFASRIDTYDTKVYNNNQYNELINGRIQPDSAVAGQVSTTTNGLDAGNLASENAPPTTTAPGATTGESSGAPGTSFPGPNQPDGLKTPIGTIPTEELQKRAQSNSRFKDAYQAELDRRGLTGEINTKERGHVETVRQNEVNRQNVRENVKGTYDVTTDEGRINYGRDYVAKNPVEAEQRALSDEPLSNELSGVYYALQEDLQAKADIAEKAGNLAEAQALDARTTAIENKMAEKLTPTAQILQFAHLWSQKSPEAMVRWAQNIYDQSNKVFNLSPIRLGKKILGKDYELHIADSQIQNIRETMRKVSRMKDPIEKAKATQDLMREVTKNIPPSVLQYTDAYRYQNMLISPLTQDRNTYFNVVNSIGLRPATIQLKAVNETLLRATGRASEGKLSDSGRYYLNMIKNLGKARDGFLNGWRGKAPTHKTEGEVGFNSYHASTGKNLPAWLTIASRGMEASDQFFTELIANAEYAVNKSHGMSDEAAKTAAYNIATKYLYRKQLDPANITGQGLVSSKLDGLTSWIIAGRKHFGPIGWFVPFVRIPMEVAKMSLEYFPLTGSVNMLQNNAKTEQLAKIQLGAMAMGVGALFAANGNTTWGAPTDQKQNKLFYDSGRKPYSFKVNIPGMGEQWVPFSYLGPAALSFMLPAAIKYYAEDSKSANTDSNIKKIGNIAMGVLQNFSQTTPLSGLGGFVNMAEGNSNFTVPTQLGFTAGQLVPFNGLVTYINNLIDPIYRMAGGTFTGQLKKGIPGLSQTLPAYTDAAGNPSQRRLSSSFLPYALGQPVASVEPLYQMRQNQLQANNVLAYNKKEIENALAEGRAPKLKDVNGKEVAGGSFGNQLEKTIYPDTTDYSSYSPAVTEKMKRSRDFGYIRKLQEQAMSLGLSPNIINAELKRKNITAQDMAYDDKTALPDDVQLTEIESEIAGLQGDDLVSTLVSMRKISEGTRKALLTDTLIGKLVDDGYITKSTGNSLKNVVWDSKTKTFKLGSGSGGTTKKGSLSMSAVNPAKATVVTPKFIGPTGSSGSGSGEIIKLKAIDTRVPTKLKTSAQAQLKLANITPNLRRKVSSLSGLGGIS